MYKATKDLIEERGLHVQTPLFLVEVEKINGGIPNLGYFNALNISDLYNKNNSLTRVISGWLVQPLKKGTNSASITQHWWNVSEDGDHFDTTPNIDTSAEYVCDFDLYGFFIKNTNILKSPTCRNILYDYDGFSMLYDSARMLFANITSLKTEHLFEYEVQEY